MIIALQTLIFFRESVYNALQRFFRPYYKVLRLTLSGHANLVEDEEEDNEEVYAEYDDEKGVVFIPPVYIQRYAAVLDCLLEGNWSNKVEKVVELGYHDISFIKYLKEVPGVKSILGVDLDSVGVQCASEILNHENYSRKEPLRVTLFEGNAAEPDYRLVGADAVIAIEMIEHMLPHDLERLVHTIFGFIRPWIAVISTPNGDFNVLFKALETNGLRRLDHYFEWSREQFNEWCGNITVRYPDYTVSTRGIGPGPDGTEHLGCCSQMALFVSKNYQKQPDVNLNDIAEFSNVAALDELYKDPDIWDTLKKSSTIINSASSDETVATELLYNCNRPGLTFLLNSPLLSMETINTLVRTDKTSQCNLDLETAKNFLMFDDVDDTKFTILMPRKWRDQKIEYHMYDIEDVVSRLNCSTFNVKTFSSKTKMLIEQLKKDVPPKKCRDLVNAIKDVSTEVGLIKTEEKDAAWQNTNWGEDMPYLHEYYKIVKEFSYPVEAKIDDSKIMNVINEEISLIVDSRKNLITTEENIRIALQDIMPFVFGYTSDVEKVRNLLQWNGYDIEDDYIIYNNVNEDVDLEHNVVNLEAEEPNTKVKILSGYIVV